MVLRNLAWTFLVILTLVGLAGCGGNNATSNDDQPPDKPSAETIASGKQLFERSCLACHGEGGVGLENLGKPLVGTEFMRNISDAELLAFIKTGRSTDDPANTTGVAMPPKGGNPALTDEQIEAIIAYLRSLGD